MSSWEAGGFNMADLVGKVAEMQQKMADVKSALADVLVEAEVGGGMVKVTATGTQRIRTIRLEREVVDSDDVEMLEDLIVAGVNLALEKSADAAQREVKKTAGGMMGPGFDLSSFGS